jgi:hypothetical protein
MAVSRLCSIPDCNKTARNSRRGWCIAHYTRWHRHGDPMGGGPEKTPSGTLMAFINTVALSWNSDECLLWPFTGNNKGYGQVRHKGRRRIVPNLICELTNGPAPTPEHETAHSCGNGHHGCINRRHLSWKTAMENSADRDKHGTLPRGERSGMAKLTEIQVRTIRTLEGKKSLNDLAFYFGVTPSTIGKIHKRHSWAWLE